MHPTARYVGCKDLGKGDRLVIATWSGQTVPSHGSVYLMLTDVQAAMLADLMRMLNKSGW